MSTTHFLLKEKLNTVLLSTKAQEGNERIPLGGMPRHVDVDTLTVAQHQHRLVF